jgi:3-hydroxyacyl-CoA dehydrogenase/enoyl-CoA hydratase/3-hydroxybutyryl-CoA epimerase/3-hydroxyacyl-CoA dehydrogenase/enoyl-CoA hydratase/3-hydroxybutyryl-CoA epimerase/enoyl-CoA isomerase
VFIADVDDNAAAAAVQEILRASPTSGNDVPVAVAVTSYEQLSEVDLVIEAVAEDEAIKTAVLSRIEPVLRPDALLTSNSSSIPMTRLAACLEKPDRFCGLHFCYPVDKRPLVEIIGTVATNASTLAEVHNYATFIGMAPIAIRDAPGFLLNRLLVPYLNEALDLVLNRADIRTIETAATNFGFPAGPLAQLDEFGMDVALEVGKTLYRSFPDRIFPSELLIAMYKAKRLGRKTGRGFYFDDGVRSDDIVPDVQKIVQRRSRNTDPVPDAEIERRLFLPMLLEATRALEESLVDSATIVDRALQDGLGMTDRYAGLFGWADAIGASTILEWLRLLQPLGQRFEPTSILLDVASREGTKLANWEQTSVR